MLFVSSNVPKLRIKVLYTQTSVSNLNIMMDRNDSL